MGKEQLKYGTDYVAWGYFWFVFNINFMGIELFGPWIGYLMVLTAIPMIELYEPEIKLLRPVAMFLIFCEWAEILRSAISMNLSINTVVNRYIFKAVVNVLGCYLKFQLITNINTALEDSGIEIKSLLTARNIQVITGTVVCIIVDLAPAPLFNLAWPAAIVNIITGFYIVWLLNTASRQLKEKYNIFDLANSR